jgi:uncharacterized protein (DUF2252 family)
MTQQTHFKVKDVAIKTGSGTASLGLDRYFVLIDGPTGNVVDDIVLEFKQARRSALYGLVPGSPEASEDHAKRIITSHTIHLVGGDPYYGHARLNGQDFLVRERSPYKHYIKVKSLDAEAMQAYAQICGQTLAQAHTRCDEHTGVMAGSAEAMILASITPCVFRADVARFAEVAADRIEADHKAFVKDHTKGAFQFV